jgi:hypothetical protein
MSWGRPRSRFHAEARVHPGRMPGAPSAAVRLNLVTRNGERWWLRQSLEDDAVALGKPL